MFLRNHIKCCFLFFGYNVFALDNFIKIILHSDVQYYSDYKYETLDPESMKPLSCIMHYLYIQILVV